MKETKCKYCGKILKGNDIHEYDGTIMCEACFEGWTSICSHCGERIWNDENDGSDSFVLCHRCYDNHYTTCERCGNIIHYDSARYFDDEDEPYCDDCYDVLTRNAIIHDYNHKPEPIFYGNDDMYMGVELEIDRGGEESSNAERLLEIANYDATHMYMKHDGSIEDGFEMVTHPISLEYHQNKMPWREIFDKALEMGYRSHKTSTCGLHIHVSRDALGPDHDAQEETIARIVYFVEAHWNELLKFSRRTESNIMRWASRYGIEANTKAVYDKAKKGNLGRYVCVNLMNYNTIEFRIFRGTLKYETFIATLQLVHEICNKAIDATDKEFETMCWSDFVKGIDKDKTELINYLKEKQLYINEPITETEEV